MYTIKKGKEEKLIDLYICGNLVGSLDRTNGCFNLQRGYTYEHIQIPSFDTMSDQEITSVLERFSQDMEVILDKIREFNRNIEIFENIMEFKLREIIPGAYINSVLKSLEYTEHFSGNLCYIIYETISSDGIGSFYSFSLTMDKLNSLINNIKRGHMDDYIDIICLSVLKNRSTVRKGRKPYT